MDTTRVGFLLQRLSDVPEGRDWLSAGECARLDGFRFPKRRNDWLLGRWTAKRALRAYCLQDNRTPPADSAWEIGSAADGAPEVLMSGDSAPVSLSLSHSADFGFCAVAAAGVALGCDLELILGRDTALIQDYFCEEERNLVSSAPEADQPLLATLIWSAKESALKCLRAGLRRDTRSVLVSLRGPGERGWHPLVVSCRESGKDFPGWWRSEGGCIQTMAAGMPLRTPEALAP